MHSHLKTAFGFVVATCLLALPATSLAAPLTFSFSSDTSAAGTPFAAAGGKDTRSASISFEHDSSTNQLVIVLTNTHTTPDVVYEDVLQAVFFAAGDWMNDLRSASAELHGDSEILRGTTPSDGSVGDRWAYNSNTPSSEGFPRFGLGSVGMDVFDNSYNEAPDGTVLDGLFEPKSGPPPKGLAPGPAYGIVSSSTDDSFQSGNHPLIQSAVEFRFNHLYFDPFAGGYAHGVSNVVFQYGTDGAEGNRLTTTTSGGEGHIIPTPSAAMAGMAMMFLMAFHTWFSRSRNRLTRQFAAAS